MVLAPTPTKRRIVDKKSAFILGLETVLGISHIGMIGMLSNNSSFPKFDLPIGQYTAYRIEADKNDIKLTTEHTTLGS